MTLLSSPSSYVPRGSNPTHVLNLLSTLVTEFKASGLESISIKELETAIKVLKQ